MSTKKTPLYDKHVALGGNVVDYAGWFLPIQYEGLIPEHVAVREKCGLFDVSHMGEVTLKGKDATAYLNYILTNDYSVVKNNQVAYSLMCYEDGGVVDDLLVYKKADDDYYIVVNASNSDKDFAWMVEHKGDFDIELNNISDTVGEIAIQGPLAEKILQKLTKFDLSSIGYYHFTDNITLDGIGEVMISRTGYTGEDGFEVYSTAEDAGKIWDAILEAGKDDGIKPCGLGCRDTLRFEASMPLYGHEISQDINPLEAGLKFFVKFKKESDFIGKKALQAINDAGIKRKLIGSELLGRGIPREGYEVQKDGKKIGHVTTGYMSPTLKKSIANILVDVDQAVIGNEVDIIIRNKPVKAVVISKKYLENYRKSKG